MAPHLSAILLYLELQQCAAPGSLSITGRSSTRAPLVLPAICGIAVAQSNVMVLLSGMSDAAAFLSYAHRDDAYLDGGLTALCQKLALVVSVRIGHDFAIFQDRTDIRWGQHWPSRLAEGLAGSRFLIPVLSPSFFTSDACQQELAQFLELERATGRRDLILPLYLLPTSLVDDPAKRADHPLATVLAERQYRDWRPLRHQPFTSRDVRQTLDELAADIVAAMTRSASAAISAPPLAPAPQRVSLDPLALSLPPRGCTPGTIFRDFDAPWCPEMVVIPAGSFVMGAPASEEGSEDEERPEHRVRFAAPFALGRFPVSFDEFDEFCDEMGRAKPTDEGWGRGRRPAINVSCEDAKAYLAWLSSRTNQAYRLPSEAEWEYVCRGGTTTPFWTGATITTDQANFDGNHLYGSGRKGIFRHHTTRVSSFPENPFGLFDMHGNVWEWCADDWHGSYSRAPSDGSPWLAGGDPERAVLRGGSWSNNPRRCRSAFRFRLARDSRFDTVGFRAARPLAEA